MQHDVFANPALRARRSYPFIVIVQSDFVGGDMTLSAPLFPATPGMAAPRSTASVTLGGGSYWVLLQQMLAVSRKGLGAPIGSVAAYREEILSVLDWLFTGV